MRERTEGDHTSARTPLHSTMSIDDVLTDLHDERVTVVLEKLSAIERQVMLRRLESIGMSTALIKHIDDLTQQILQLEARPGQPDQHWREREQLERERRGREFQLQNEAIQKWRDVQLLRQEGRHDQRELKEEEQRYDAING